MIEHIHDIENDTQMVNMKKVTQKSVCRVLLFDLSASHSGKSVEGHLISNSSRVCAFFFLSLCLFGN